MQNTGDRLIVRPNELSKSGLAQLAADIAILSLSEKAFKLIAHSAFVNLRALTAMLLQLRLQPLRSNPYSFPV